MSSRRLRERQRTRAAVLAFIMLLDTGLPWPAVFAQSGLGWVDPPPVNPWVDPPPLQSTEGQSASQPPQSVPQPTPEIPAPAPEIPPLPQWRRPHVRPNLFRSRRRKSRRPLPQWRRRRPLGQFLARASTAAPRRPQSSARSVPIRCWPQRMVGWRSSMSRRAAPAIDPSIPRNGAGSPPEIVAAGCAAQR